MSSSAQLANAVHGARAIASNGDRRGALALLGQALGTATTTLGPDDPDVLAATGQLARYHVELGELNDARRVLEEGLAAGQHRLGDGHAVMLGLAYELARIADELGNVFEAKRRYGQLVKFGPQALGEGHPSVLAARQYLGAPEPNGSVYVPQTPPPQTAHPAPQPMPMQPMPMQPMPVQQMPPQQMPVQQIPVQQVPPQQMPVQPVAMPPVSAAPVDPSTIFWPDEDRDDDDPPVGWQQTEPGVLQHTAAQQPPQPPQQPLQPMPVVPERPMSPPLWQVTPPDDEEPRPRRSPLVAILVIIIVALIGGGIAAGVAFFAAGPKHPAADAPTGGAPTNSTKTDAPASKAPTAAASAGPLGNSRAPGGLKLQDDKTSITLSWTDPTQGSVPFVVAGGSQGTMRELQGLAAGTTKYTISGLNPGLEYCFTVAAIYGTQDVQLSNLACTKRK